MEQPEPIKTLSDWDFPDKRPEPDGYDTKYLPDATYRNMEVMMEKINELVKEINKLKGINDD